MTKKKNIKKESKVTLKPKKDLGWSISGNKQVIKLANNICHKSIYI